jgi:hypothetical protein
MNKTLIALTAAAGFAVAGLAVSPAAAAPLAPKYLGFSTHQASQVELASHRHYRLRRHVVRRHFWAPGPWAFRGLPYHHCFPVRGGYYCYF